MLLIAWFFIGLVTVYLVKVEKCLEECKDQKCSKSLDIVEHGLKLAFILEKFKESKGLKADADGIKDYLYYNKTKYWEESNIVNTIFDYIDYSKDVNGYSDGYKLLAY